MATKKREAPERLPRGRHGLSREQVRTSQRTRLLDAMAQLAAEKGFPNVTIGDVVALGGLAKRTFYDYFPDKDACALAAGEHFAEKILAAIIRPHDRDLDLYLRVQTSVGRMLEVFAEHPDYARTFSVEIWAAGPKVIAHRLEVDRQIARVLVALSEDVSAHRPGARAIEEAHALAVVGAVKEYLYRTIFYEGAERLPAIADKVIPLVAGLLMAEIPSPAAPKRPAAPPKAARKTAKKGRKSPP